MLQHQRRGVFLRKLPVYKALFGAAEIECVKAPSPILPRNSRQEKQVVLSSCFLRPRQKHQRNRAYRPDFNGINGLIGARWTILMGLPGVAIFPLENVRFLLSNRLSAGSLWNPACCDSSTKCQQRMAWSLNPRKTLGQRVESRSKSSDTSLWFR